MARPTPQPASRVPLIISIVALCVSSGHAFFFARNYYVTHRPYVGIVQHHYYFSPPPSSRMDWEFVLKNTGSIPAKIKVVENQGFVTTAGNTKTLQTQEVFGSTLLLMPGQQTGIHGGLSEAGGLASAGDVRTGKTTLDVAIRLTYEPTSRFLWKDEYHYSARMRFWTVPQQPQFIMLSPEAD